MVKVWTLGCKLNQYDSARINSLLEEIDREIIILNTCAVTKNAEDEARKVLRKIKRENPESIVVAFGCAVKASRDEFEKMKEVDLCAETEDELLKKFSIKKREWVLPHFVNRTRPFLKIQEGCNGRCSYCIVPQLRGKSTSRDLDEILKEFREYISKGFKEIVLTGTNLSEYGVNLKSSLNLIDVLKTLIKEEGDFRIRLSSLEPKILNQELIDFLKENQERICPHLHIPIQSGSEKVLKEMRRESDLEKIKSFILKIDEEIPFVGIGADIICCYPTESEKDFEDSFNFLNSLPISFYHIFTYSPRKNTFSYNLKTIPSETLSERKKLLLKLKEKEKFEFLKKNCGRKMRFITLKPYKGYGRALSGNFIEVRTSKLYSHNEFRELRVKLKDDNIPFGVED
jgi:threonylcarbamoyladenosine tRNA methylthiotransferase MtaB